MSDGSNSGFVYSAQLVKSIERTVSHERLKRYLAAANNDVPKALHLYDANVALSETIYGVLHGVEIAIRNAMHYELSTALATEHWFDKVQLAPYLGERVVEAMLEAGGSKASAGKVIAELPFGFWTDLTARRNHWSLWVPYLHKAFPNAKVPRPAIHRRLEDIRRLRNRIAHHEPILTAQKIVYVGHGRSIALAQIDECVGWVCPDTAAWLRAKSRFRMAGIILAQVHSTGITF